MTNPPISYPDARETVAAWLHIIRSMGPDAHGMTREKYVKEVERLDNVEKLLADIIEYKAERQKERAAKVSRETGGRS